MTTSHGRSGDDVRTWPADTKAAQALREYLDALPADSRDVLAPLAAGDLDFAGADLSGLDLPDADFIEASLSGVRLSGADLDGALFYSADLRGADLSGADLHKAKGRACNAQGAIFRRANLDRSEFDDANLRDANMSGVQFGRAFLHSADLRGANLSGAAFGPRLSTNLTEARLAGCRLTGATGRVDGPVDIGTDDARRLIDGDELQAWFSSQGAQVEVTPPTAS